MRRARPLRFLALVLGGWLCLRATMLAPDWWAKADPVVAAAAASRPKGARAGASAPVLSRISAAVPVSTAVAPQATPAPIPVSILVLPPRPLPIVPPSRPPPVQFHPPSQPQFPLATSAPAKFAGRWSGSAWLLLRDERGGAVLAPGGTLGGSQAGARLLYRVGDGLALSARAYLPLRRTRGAEAAAGIDWRPVARVPVNILLERRHDLGGEGRSAFALTLYGGIERRLPGGLRAETYAQAGVVGLRARGLFVDGAARIGLPVGPVEIGGGAWGAAQPGAARLDAGPSLSWRLPVRGADLHLRADWRFRIAGDAAPGSGPALTLAAGF